MTSAPPARAQSDDLFGSLKRVEEVRIEGNAALSSATIRKVVRTGAGSFLGLRSPPLYRPDFLRADVLNIQNLCIRRGFLDARVSASADSGRTSGHVIVTYRVEEGERVLVRRLTIDSTTTVYRPEQLRAFVGTREGLPFDPVQVALDRETIASRYAERGRFPTIASETERDSLGMNVAFRINEGLEYHVRGVTIEGVAKVDTFAVRRELLLKPNSLFVRDRMVRSTERLYDTGLFSTVEISPSTVDTTSGEVDLGVRVRERKPRWVEGGLGTGTLERVRLSGQWGHRNLTGDGKALTTNVSFGWFRSDLVSGKAEVAFVEPWFLRTRTRGRVATSVERAFEVFANRSYIQEAAGLSFGLSRDFFGAKSRLSATVDNSWTRVAKVVAESPGDTSSFFIAPYVRRITLAFDQDRRDDPIDPRSGFLSNLTGQVGGASRGNTGRYLKTEGSYGRHFPYQKAGSFGVRGRLGRIGPWGDWHASEDATIDRVPVTDRYRVGGSSTVRGYHENGIDAGGEAGLMLLVTNFEARLPIHGRLGMTLFVDGGNVWRHWSDFKWKQLVQTSGVGGTFAVTDYHWSYGGGLRYLSPIGPVRLEVGQRLRQDESDRLAGRKPDREIFHFSFGSQF